MKAWIIKDFSDVEHADLVEVADPKPGAGEAVLRVGYAALNPADAYLAKGQYPANPPLPHVLGRDGIGEVIALGEGTSGVSIGEKRAILRGETGVSRWGTFAEQVAVSADALVEVPAGWTDQQAAAAPLVYLTAYQALTQWGKLPDNAVVLISGASGGVGVAATQMALAMGCTVVGLSRGPQKRETLKSLGMQLALDPTHPQWGMTLKGQLGQRRVDLIIDNVGGSLLPEMINLLGMNGRVSVVGRLAGEIPSFNTASLLFRRVRIGGVAVGSYSTEESREAWRAIVDLLSRTNARPLIDQVFPFAQLPAAFAKLTVGPMGKVLLAVGASQG
jgi:NADPH2:quinone reductase